MQNCIAEVISAQMVKLAENANGAFDYEGYLDGYVDGDLISYYVSSFELALLLTTGRQLLTEASGGLYTATYQTTNGMMVEVEIGEELLADGTMNIAGIGALADVVASNGQDGYNKGDSDPYNISDESKEKWGKGTFDSTEDSLKHHFDKHGEEVGAKDIDQYVRKAEGFSQNLKGASKSYPDNGTPGAIRYTKNGKYIIIGPDGKILSYGLAR